MARKEYQILLIRAVLLRIIDLADDCQDKPVFIILGFTDFCNTLTCEPASKREKLKLTA